MSTPEVGTVVGGNYRVEEGIGEGGFARAFRAVDLRSGETVVLKCPNYEGSNNDPAVIDEYFRQEARTLERVREAGGHPNVMDLYEARTEDGTVRLVVEYVDGYDLDEAIESVGPITDTEYVRRVGIELCSAMSFLHENEIVYRDLKPDNVMVTERDGEATPVLIDFNTATVGGGAGDGTGTTILGSYKPREVARAAESDSRQGPWSDVYSIGKILLFLLKGTVPDKDGVDPRDFGADCEPYLGEVVARATATDPDDRYPNATVVKQVLESRDPAPPPAARLSYLQGEREFTVYPGDTVGRRYASGPTPSVAVEDEGEHVSTVQFAVETDADGWYLRDHSLNGTYVQDGSGWQRVLSETGRERLRERGEDPTDSDGAVPPTTCPLSDGDLVAPVHPSYGVTFRFREA